jgi:hypothetical protein
MSKRNWTAAMLASIVMVTGVAGAARAGEAARHMTTSAARLQQLEDRAAIEELLVTYGRLLDKRDLVGYSKLFAADGVWEGGIGTATGPAQILDMLTKVFARVPPGQYGSNFHVMSSFSVQIDGSTATSWSRWTWFIEGADGKPSAQRSGHYEDQLVKVDGEWKFKHRLTVTELPSAEKDEEAKIYRKDYRDSN